MTTFRECFHEVIAYESRSTCDENLRHFLTCGVVKSWNKAEELGPE